MRTIIIGGVAGGASAATRLRRLDEQHEIVVLERSGYVSFANCGLPYYIGGTIADRKALLLQTPRSLHARFGLDVRVNSEVIAIDPSAQTVTVRALAEGGREYTERYDHLILSPGASPIVPPIPGIERAMTLRTIEDTDRIKERVDTLLAAVDTSEEAVGGQALSAVVVGGGFIGLEMAESLRERDMDVTVVELAPQVMAPLDPEMAAIVAAELRRNGVQLALGVQVTEVRAETVVLSDGRELDADLVIMSIGVRPDVTLARAAGLELGPRGGIKVDAQMRTSDPHIFAVGDAVDKSDATTGEPTLVPLANSANRQGRLVADVIAGRSIRFGGVLGTAIVKVFSLTVATTGVNEKRLKASGRNYMAIHTHPGSHAGYYPGAIDVLATAIIGGIRADELADLELAYAPPFGSAKDPVNQLGYVADNLMTGTTHTIGWDAVAGTDRFLVDVRTAGEHRRGHIEGSVNIPVDELRARHVEIPRNGGGPVPVAVYCQVGQRGHTAARLLTQLGYDVVNVDGGWLTYSLAHAG
ncbi:MAG: FAD-dependent oxidoreductase [Candidatus Nanopelagicales bacterium]|nr:FAD-dependent oxidoreductase [Candidatus Nanopelagicales bacterium]